MYLQRIELSGFKSFALPTVLDFSSNLVGIVGPNGSGKSNISDAIRWVLGEQSAKAIRGSCMDDVIFAGTDEVAAAGHAEISITFDNFDRFFNLNSDTMKITRRLYRDGGSEYRLGDRRVRLKDLKALFWDTGINQDAYSTIGQGQIDRILDTTSRGRRELLEEVAGIHGYRVKRADAVKKLEETQGNINRLRDLIFELNNQLLPLEAEAQRAQKLLYCQAELKQKTLKLKARNYSDLLFEFNGRQALLVEYQQKIHESTSTISSLETEIKQLKIQLEELDSKIHREKEKNFKTFNQIELLEHRKTQLEEEITRLTRHDSELVRRINQQKEHHNKLQNQIDGLSTGELSLTERRQQLLKIRTEAENKLKTVNQRLNDYQTSSSQAHDNTMSSFDRLFALKRDRDVLEKDIRFNSEQLKRLQRDLAIIKTDLENSRSSAESFREEIDKLKQRRQQLSHFAAGGSVSGSGSKLEAELENLNEISHQVTAELESINSKIALISDDYDETSFLGPALAELIRAARQGKINGIFGVAAQLIQVSDEYQLALEAAAGAGLKNLITDTAACASNCIAFLKQNRLGRASFIPLDRIHTEPFQPLSRQVSGYLGTFYQLADFPAEIDRAALFLLGKLHLFQTLNQALDYQRTNRFRGKLVTLDGQLVHATGLMQGGSFKPKLSGRLGQLNRQELLNRAESLHQKLADIAARRRELQYRLEQAREQHSQGRVDLSTLSYQIEDRCNLLEKNRQFVNSRNQELKALTDEEKSLSELINNQQRDFSVLTDEIEILEQTTQNLEADSSNLKSTINQLIENREQLTAKISGFEIELARLDEEERSGTRQEEILKAEQNRLGTEISELKTELNDNSLNVQKHQQQLAELSDQLAEIKNQTGIILSELEKMKYRRQDLTETLEIKEGVSRSRNTSIRIFEKKLNDARVEISELTTHRSYLWQEILELGFENDEEKLLEFSPRDILPASLQAEIDGLNEQIEMLGTVNPGAIEEFQRLSDRHQTLSTQNRDLIKAREDILQAICDIDKTSEKMFTDCLDQVNVYFNELVEFVFQGGAAQLVLTQPDLPLSSPLEIEVQLPGKNVRFISLLSGGERAMVALSMLFAVLKYKPTPFCILDEAEAPLDDSNVARFVRLLSSFADKTQFIIITHNKETMKALDILYGVTMDQAGISRLISVKLANQEDSENSQSADEDYDELYRTDAARVAQIPQSA